MQQRERGSVVRSLLARWCQESRDAKHHVVPLAIAWMLFISVSRPSNFHMLIPFDYIDLLLMLEFFSSVPANDRGTSIHGGPKNGYPHFCQSIRQMLTDFHNYFTDRRVSKFAIKLTVNIPPHLTNVASLPCEISEFKNAALKD